MKPYDFHPEALQEAINAKAYLELQQSGLGTEFDLEVTATIQKIRQQPRLYPIELGRVRRCILPRFSYNVLCADLPGRIWIAAVAGDGRRPYYWRQRRP